MVDSSQSHDVERLLLQLSFVFPGVLSVSFVGTVQFSLRWLVICSRLLLPRTEGERKSGHDIFSFSLESNMDKHL